MLIFGEICCVVQVFILTMHLAVVGGGSVVFCGLVQGVLTVHSWLTSGFCRVQGEFLQLDLVYPGAL